MEIVNHKLFGVGDVVKKEGNYLTVRFRNDNIEKRFVIPQSFTLGLLVAEGDLDAEIKKAIAEEAQKAIKAKEIPVKKTIINKPATKKVNAEFHCSPDLSPKDIEIVDLLSKLCPDFTNYDFLKCDLYKGSLLGGTNIYFKKGKDGKNGMVATQTAIKKFKLDAYPYNFEAEGVGKGNAERGWTGNVLLSMLKDLLKKYT